jgi:hypothetical protein
VTSLPQALRSFAERIAELDSPASPAVTTVQVDGEPVALTASAVEALTDLLEEYRDPRSNGDCDRCGGRRIDRNFICLDCGHANGVFGQLLMERSSHYPGDPRALPADPG